MIYELGAKAVNNTHTEKYIEKKAKRFTCIQQMFCRNKIRPWCFFEGQLLKK